MNRYPALTGRQRSSAPGHTVLMITLLVLVTGARADALELFTGIKAGFGMSIAGGKTWHDFLEGNDAEPSPLTGFGVGGFLRFRFSESVSVQLEVLSIDRGGRAEYDAGGTVDVTYRAPTLELPLLYRAEFPAGPGSLLVLAGPSLFLATGSFSQTFESTVTNEDIRLPDRGVRPGFAVSGGYSLPLGQTVLDAEMRFSRPLTDPWEDLAIITNGFALLLSCQIGI